MLNKTCEMCEKPFQAREADIKRGLARFCSKICFSSFRKKNADKYSIPKAPNVTCAWCGLAFYKNNSKKRSSKSGLFFCCRAHKDIAQRTEGIKAIQPIHYGNGQASYREFAFRTLPNKCNRCNFDRHMAALVVHHKDRDRANCAVSNLEILCANCHAIEHWA